MRNEAEWKSVWICRSCVQLLKAHGERKKAHWLNLLRNLMVVGGAVREHQTIVMQLLVKHKEDLLLLYPTDAHSSASTKIYCQMEKDLDTLTSDELSVRSQGCQIAYHEACVQVLADICVGAEPTFIVQISEYINLEQVCPFCFSHLASCLRVVLFSTQPLSIPSGEDLRTRIVTGIHIGEACCR